MRQIETQPLELLPPLQEGRVLHCDHAGYVARHPIREERRKEREIEENGEPVSQVDFRLYSYFIHSTLPIEDKSKARGIVKQVKENYEHGTPELRRAASVAVRAARDVLISSHPEGLPIPVEIPVFHSRR